MNHEANTARVPAWCWVAALLAVAVSHTLWFVADQRGPSQDQFRYYETALHLRGDPLAAPHDSHPPLYSALAALVPGRTFHALRLINVVLALVTLLAAWHLARHFLSPLYALMAALCGTLTPLVVSVTHLFYCENLLLPLCLLALDLFLDQRTRTQTARAVLLGFVCAAGCLAKWTFPIFIAPAAVLWWCHAVTRARWSSALVCIALATPWYLLHASDISAFMEQGVLGGAGQISRVEGVAGWLYYPKALAGSWLGFMTVAAAAIGLLHLWRTRRHQALCVASALLLPLIAFSLVATKKPRHLLPLLPLLAILTTLALERIRNTTARRSLAGVFIAATLAAGFAVAFCEIEVSAGNLGPLPVCMRPHSDDPGAPGTASVGAALALKSTTLLARGSISLLSFHTPTLRDTDLRAAVLERSVDVHFRLLPLHLPASDGTVRFPLHAIPDPDGSAGLLEASSLWVKSGMLWTRVQSGLPVHRHAAAVTESVLDPDGALATLRVLHEERLEDGSICRLLALPQDAVTRRSMAQLALQHDPENPDAWALLQIPKAQQNLRTLVELGIWPAAALKLADPEAAAAAAETLLANHSHHLGVLSLLAQLQGDCGISARRLIDLRDAFYTRNGNAETVAYLVRAHFACGDQRAAWRWLYRGLLAGLLSTDKAKSMAVDTGLPSDVAAESMLHAELARRLRLQTR
ncbi:MAG: hypothetical protein EXS14_05900 [Planctomycetes bacterium]|nr:hypothetical protein [Planctomycetota bacterium]